MTSRCSPAGWRKDDYRLVQMTMLRFFRTPALLKALYPTLLWRKDPHQKCIYLTFDDGPVPGPTTFVLDTLRQFHAKATFFCIGDNIRKHPDVFKRILEEEHAVGNHTFHHLNAWKNSTDDYNRDTEKCNKIILENLPEERKGQYPNLFRPPYGRIKRSHLKWLKSYQIVMWDALSYDFDQTLSPEKCLEGTTRAIRNGSVVVFHDSIKAEKNLTYALPRLLENFSKQGYVFNSLK